LKDLDQDFTIYDPHCVQSLTKTHVMASIRRDAILLIRDLE